MNHGVKKIKNTMGKAKESKNPNLNLEEKDIKLGIKKAYSDPLCI